MTDAEKITALEDKITTDAVATITDLVEYTQSTLTAYVAVVNLLRTEKLADAGTTNRDLWLATNKNVLPVLADALDECRSMVSRIQAL